MRIERVTQPLAAVLQNATAGLLSEHHRSDGAPAERASYYIPNGDRGPSKTIPKHLDTPFPRSPQPNDIIFDVVTVSAAADRFDGFRRAMRELKLQPMLIRPTVGAAKKVDGEEEASGSSSASPTARKRQQRLWMKPRGGMKGKTPADAQTPEVTTVPQRRCPRHQL